MLIVGRWITFLVYYPHLVVHRRWGWSGIFFAWTAIVILGALAGLAKGETSHGEVQILVGGIVILAFIAWHQGSTSRPDRMQTTSRADVVSGQGLFAMDLTFFSYLESVMRRTRQASDAEVQTAIRSHATRLADQDPRCAIEYRSAMHAESARDWPPEASHDLVLEWERPWAPTPASDAVWRKLPTSVRGSYSRQGSVMM